MSEAPAEPRDAATVVLLRPAKGRFETFMVRRHDKSGFMAGAYVFPGGVLDDGDVAPDMRARVTRCTPEDAARALGEDDGERALGLYVAGIRETFEEAGVLLAEGLGAQDLVRPREQLNAGAPFLPILNALDATLRLDELVPWSRWLTPVIERRRYDTRFFVARTRRAQRAVHDQVEVTAGEWMTPERALARHEANEISLPPPTLRTLETLEAEPTLDAVFARAAGRVPKVVQPEPVSVDGALVLALPGDPLHSLNERRIDGTTRFILRDGRFASVDG